MKPEPAPYTPSQIGQCERVGRTTMTVTRFLLNEAKLFHFLWVDNTAIPVYLLNRTPNNTIRMETTHR